MSAHGAVIVGIGMTSAVGLSATETAASARAGTTRFAGIPMLDSRFDAFVVAQVAEDGLPDLVEGLAAGLTSREVRLLRLGTMPLREALAPLAAVGAAPGLELALPEMATTRTIDPAAFLQRFARQVGGGFDLARSEAKYVGRAGGLQAIGRAVTRVATGEAEFVLAGGIDSFRDPYILGTLDLERRVKTVAHLDGFIPGEGAAFVLLGSREAAARAKLAPVAAVSAVSEAFEAGHLYATEPYRGEGLALALSGLVASGAATGPLREVYSSMNGESHWAKEWGVGFLRNRDAFAPDHAMHHPADSVGDVGAACGPLMVGLSALGIRRGYRRAPCLVYCSSDRGARAALTVDKA